MENSENILKEIEKEIQIGKKHNISAEEILQSIKNNWLPPEKIYIQPETKTPKEKLEYLRAYHLEQKRIKKIKAEEERKQEKIKKALQRTAFFCYNCKKNIRINNPEDNKSSTKLKKNGRYPCIIITNICPHCDSKVKAFGGYLR